jgi:hypothetical protein
MAFRLEGIDPAFSEPLFALPDDELRQLGAMRCVADSDRGFPCRASLQDARTGEELLLLPYAHQPAASPYRATGPIFIRRGATRAVLPPGVVPPYVSRRLMSLRAYDAGHMMVDAEVCEGAGVAAELARMFDHPSVDYIHLHNARRGCFSCVALRH